MPVPITEVYQQDISKLMSPGSEKRQSMRGFDDDYVDIVDYIVRCTHKIWEEHAIGLIYTHYTHNCIVHTAYGTTHGIEHVVKTTLQAQAGSTNELTYADDVIWSGNDENGFYSSHRWTGISLDAQAGRRITLHGCAECFVRENRIIEEWLVRDTIGGLRQRGLDPKQVVADIVKRGGYEWLASEGRGDIERTHGQLPPPVWPAKKSDGFDGFDVEDFVRRSYHEIWNWRLLNKVDAYYAKNHLCHMTGQRELYGRAALRHFIISMLAMFPDGAMDIDHFAWLGNDRDGYRVATRWTFQGTHEGHGVYGAPTNKRVQIMGVSHHHINGGQFIQEWTLFDEVALMLQLAL